jgi:hypothetical protein
VKRRQPESGLKGCDRRTRQNFCGFSESFTSKSAKWNERASSHQMNLVADP